MSLAVLVCCGERARNGGGIGLDGCNFHPLIPPYLLSLLCSSVQISPTLSVVCYLGWTKSYDLIMLTLWFVNTDLISAPTRTFVGCNHTSRYDAAGGDIAKRSDWKSICICSYTWHLSYHGHVFQIGGGDIFFQSSWIVFYILKDNKNII